MAVIPTSDKILIVLQYWKEDHSLAMELARLIADLEGGHCKTADILFVSRFDCEHDMETIKYVSRKFNVSAYTPRRRSVGWPNGCNGLFFGGLDYIYHMMEAGKCPRYKAILFLGADGGPFHRDWIYSLSSAWDRVNAEKKVCVAGALIDDPNFHHPHINGDCCFITGDLGFLKWLTKDVSDVNQSAGWDWLLSSEFERRGWADIPSIRSLWRHPLPFTEAHWLTTMSQGIVWLHGIKDKTLIRLSRKILLS